MIGTGAERVSRKSHSPLNPTELSTSNRSPEKMPTALLDNSRTARRIGATMNSFLAFSLSTRSWVPRASNSVSHTGTGTAVSAGNTVPGTT